MSRRSDRAAVAHNCDSNYIQETGRGTVIGTLTIADTGAPTASAGDMSIGLAPDDGLDPEALRLTSA